jgi:hypothetical protein
MVLGLTILILINNDRDEHLKGGMLQDMEGAQPCSDLPRLNVLPPLELAAWLNQDEIQFPWEPCLLYKEEHAIVNILSEQLLEGGECRLCLEGTLHHGAGAVLVL